MEEREGFRVRKDVFEFDWDKIVSSPPKTKREATICNLFVNQNLPIREIVKALDEKPENVIQTLIRKEIVYDRRITPYRQLGTGDRRRLVITK